MIRYFRATFNVFWRYRYLLANLVSRDIKVKYRRSTLGLLWSVLNPLLMTLVMTLVFGLLFSQIMEGQLQVVPATGMPPAFAAYVLPGQLVFAFYNESTNMAMDSVLGSAQLIKKVYIPKYIFPLEKVLFSLINAIFSLISLALVIIVTRTSLNLWALLAPFVLALLAIFNLGVGLILSAAVVFFRDIKHLYTVFVLALTYMTPIFYSEAIFAGNRAIETLIRLNPLYWFVSLFRQVVVYGSMPTATQIFIPLCCAGVALGAGLLIFRGKQDDFILYL